MKLSKQILEAILRGISLAIDDFDDAQAIETQKVGLIKHSLNTREMIINKHFVDLDLPSGILWAKYNLGVNPNKLNIKEDWYGNYYAWGELEPKSNYCWETYKFCKIDLYTLKKYLTKYAPLNYENNEHPYDQIKADGIESLLPEDDVATLMLGKEYNVKIPSQKLCAELINYTEHEWVTNYNNIPELNGMLFISKTNGNELFIPAAGNYSGIAHIADDYYGYVWASDLYAGNPFSGVILYFHRGHCTTDGIGRYDGNNIRPVFIK